MSLPYFPMYPSDFEAKTSHLTVLEDGAYNRLIRICWMTPGCDMPADDAWVMRRARAHSDEEKAAVKAVLDEFFTVENKRYSNARIKREYHSATEAHEKRKNAGAKGGKAKALKSNDLGSSNAKPMLKQPEPEPEPLRDTNVSHATDRSKPLRFEEFWGKFPHRGGAKKDRKSSMQKYTAAIKRGVPEAKIIDAASRYQNDRQVIDGYGKGPVPWLNSECWNDEIETQQLKAISGGKDAAAQIARWDRMGR